MKKVAFILVLVALVTGSAYAGSVVAAPKPATSGTVVMGIESGDDTVTNECRGVGTQTYPSVRHVSLTVCAGGLATYYGYEDWVSLEVNVKSGVRSMLIYTPSNDGDLLHFEFDTDYWRILVYDNQGEGINGIRVVYNATVTYFS